MPGMQLFETGCAARAFLWCAGALLLAGCASTPRELPVGDSPWAAQSGAAGSVGAQSWVHKTFPGKAPTRFGYARLDGRDTLEVHADGSASILWNAVRIPTEQLGWVRFSWKVPALMAQADLALRDKDDATVRIVLAFDGDRSRFAPRDTALAELVRVVTGEEMPYATLMYVWCNRRAPGTVIPSPRSDRIRKLVVESGPRRLDEWLEYERDIRADYERSFGEPPGALVGIGIMTDSDNTRSRTQAWYGPVRFVPPAHGGR